MKTLRRPLQMWPKRWWTRWDLWQRSDRGQEEQWISDLSTEGWSRISSHRVESLHKVWTAAFINAGDTACFVSSVPIPSQTGGLCLLVCGCTTPVSSLFLREGRGTTMRNHIWMWHRRPASPGRRGPWAGCETWLGFWTASLGEGRVCSVYSKRLTGPYE